MDDALRTAQDRPELATLGERLNAEQLRTMALNAQPLLTAAAAAEYDHYVKLREELREAPAEKRPEAEDASAGSGGGAGASAVIAVLAPVLAGTAMLIFLLVGYILKLIEPEPSFAETLITTGWLFGALTVVAVLAAAVGLLVAAVRNSATEVVATGEDTVPDEVSRARDAWRHALLERGIVPFLRDALADPNAGPGLPAPRMPGAGRIPDLGYTRPDFSSPGSPSQGTRPGYTAPDFTSPDFGGPENEPQ
ncbi:hypothetical protein [Streptomyces sp. WAC06614]|uniref:hypothetical protein n=1 Tax=Streptomyces sp. WAC06614 TaxID=2487416 RepID=UPI0021B03E41|nr:hypothetical protein [Streptomyces sp. WAC06614]